MALGMRNEEHTLLCSYQNIPKVITISTYTTEMEQLRLSSDNFHQAMIESILPKVIEPEIPVGELYEIDYYLILRHLRLMTWGPFFTVGTYYCKECRDESGSKGKLYREKRTVRLDEIQMILPDEGKAIPTTHDIKRDQFIFTDADIHMTMNRCRDILLIEKTKVSESRKTLLPMAVSIRTVTGVDFVDVTEAVDWLANLPAVDFEIINQEYNQAFGYGLSTRGDLECPVCGGKGWFFAPINDYYFRPDRENIQEWAKILRASRSTKKSS